MAPTTPNFQKIITDARERKKNSALADRIFSRDRRQSAPSKLKATPGGSLASRVGVKKTPHQRITAAETRRSSLPAGNVNGDWTHDLHDTVNGAAAKGGSLGSRITFPGANNKGSSKKPAKRQARLAAALDKMDTDQVNVVTAPSTRTAGSAMGMSIRGLAGPYAIMGQNFAPGTTAADIESAMTPVGGEMVSCKVIKTKPFLIAEMVFSSREGGERVIERFNDKTADGRVIKIYPKIGGYQPSAAERNDPPANAPSGPRASKSATRDQVVDGSMGFPDLINTNSKGSGSSGNNKPLYSDRLVGGNRRGRGNQRGRGGR